MARSISIKNLAGVKFVINCMNRGMLSIGKMKPDNITAGKSDTNVATENANCCESAITETKIPIEVEAEMNIKVVMNKSRNEPFTSIPKRI